MSMNPQDIDISRDHLPQFYKVLHQGLIGKDQVCTNFLIVSVLAIMLQCIPDYSIISQHTTHSSLFPEKYLKLEKYYFSVTVSYTDWPISLKFDI